jgi:hypothetical protein
MSTTTIVATVSPEEMAKERVERERELQRLALAVIRSTARGSSQNDWSMDRKLRVADLMVFLGLLHDIPQAKQDWIDGR